jgi:hypothetical protein
MAKVFAVTEAIKSLAVAESKLNLRRSEDEAFFTEWQTELPPMPQYALSRAFSIYTIASELRSAFPILKHLGEGITHSES